MPKNYFRDALFACPFYTGDEGNDKNKRYCIHCSGGQKLHFRSLKEQLDWIGRYCGDVSRWNRCSIAGMLWDRFE